MHAQHDGGDHVILVGRVVAATSPTDHRSSCTPAACAAFPPTPVRRRSHVAKTLLDGADLKLGLFSANCSSGMAVTKIEDRWQATWDDNLRLGRLADEVGIDFMLPIARWIGYGGETNFHEGVLDPVALAAGTARRDRADLRLRDDPHRLQPPARGGEGDGDRRPDRQGPRGPQHRGGLEQARIRRDGRRSAAGSRRPLRLRAGVVGDRRAPLDRAGPLRHRRPLLAAEGCGVDAEALRRAAADPQRRLVDAGTRFRRRATRTSSSPWSAARTTARASSRP